MNYRDITVSIETAKELKKIGFDEECIFQHYLGGEVFVSGRLEEESVFDYVNHNFSDIEKIKNEDHEETLAVPTYEQVFGWFRSKGIDGFIIPVYREKTKKYAVNVLVENSLLMAEKHESYREARLELIKALIETYKTIQDN